jgi:hypothetical protein
LIRQKIDEPPTPYHPPRDFEKNGYESGSESESITSARSSGQFNQEEIKHHWEAINAQLEYHQNNQTRESNEVKKEETKSPIQFTVSNRSLLHLNDFGEIQNPDLRNIDICSARSVKLSDELDQPKTPIELEKEKDFKQKRSAHYNEYRVRQAFLQKTAINDEDEI